MRGRSRSDKARKQASPAKWPQVSLMRLKWSMSKRMMVNAVFMRLARLSSAITAVLKYARLRIWVRPSVVESSCSRSLASLSCSRVAFRSVVRDWTRCSSSRLVSEVTLKSAC